MATKERVSFYTKALEVQTSELAVQAHVSDKDLTLMMERDASQRVYVLTMMMEGLAMPLAEVSWPADWWQAMKERWFPQWLRRISPVQYETRYFARYCPHAFEGKPEPHFEFLNSRFPNSQEAGKSFG